MARLISVLLLSAPALVLSEEAQLRGGDVQEEPSTMQKFYRWATEKEAAPATEPALADYLMAEAAAQQGQLKDFSASVLAEPSNSAPQWTSECYTFTGGTCIVGQCNANRSAVCEAGKCICGSGCGAADGTCSEESNKLIAKGFTLSNVKWPSYKMYFKRVSTFGQMSTTNAPSLMNAGADKFSLYQLPGELDGKPKFFVASEKWAEYVLAIRPTTGTAVSPFGTYGVKLQDQTIPWNPQDVMMTVCSLAKRGYPNAIMIGSSGAVAKPIWSYVHHGSWYIYGSVTNLVGKGGYWNVDPPLPEGSVPECDETA